MAKIEEISGISYRIFFEIVDGDDLPDDANVFGGRFDLSFKNVRTPNEKPEALYIAKGYRDVYKELMIHNTSTMQQKSIMIASYAAIRGYRIFFNNIEQSYLQSAAQFVRGVYFIPTSACMSNFVLQNGQLPKLKSLLYRLWDSGHYWSDTFHASWRAILGLKLLREDPSFYLHDNKEHTHGMFEDYIDAFLGAGDHEFAKVIEEIPERFETKERECGLFTFFGIRFWQKNNDNVTIDQNNYIWRLSLISEDVSF